MPITQNQQKLIDLALKDAAAKRLSAGYNGSYGDDGAGIIEGHASLKKYEQQIDPEWETYLRLQEKFANKY